MDKRLRFRGVSLFVFLAYIAVFCLFYYKYVPLVKSFQMVLIPILLVVFVLTCFSLKSGILVFVFFFPLINNLPYFFGINGGVPHAPTSLVLFLVFFLGWLLRSVFSPFKLDFNHPIFKPLVLFSLIVVVSGIITFFRYANFYPFFTDNIYELTVNINGVRAGGAIMSDVFSCLNYLTGFLFFIIISSTIKSNDFVKKLLIVLSAAILISLLFSLIQKYYSISLGNTSYWVKLNQINSTFKDPNSFGAILSSFLPVLLGMVFAFPKKLKLFFLLLIIIGLFIFPSIGSRSGLLGLAASVITFFLLYFKCFHISFRKRVIYVVSFLFIFFLLVFSFYFFSKQTNLYQRIGWSLDVIANRESLNRLFSRKFDFWISGSSMIKESPLTGVGVGAFIVELPNHLNRMGKPLRYTDSAENYIVQVGSEMGLIGIFLIFWLFFEVFKLFKKNCQKPSINNRANFIVVGAISGTISLFINFFFHSYIGAFDVKYFFWFLIALVFICSRANSKPESHTKLNRKFSFVAISLLLSFGIVHLWYSTHSLTLEKTAKKYGWNQDFGFYQQERDDRGVYFRWAEKQAGISVENVGSVLVIPVMASHPDIEEKPVKIRIYSANSRFKKKKLEKEIILNKSEWINFEYSTPDIAKEKIYLVFETNRDWQPLKYLGVPDPRWIAIALGEVWFKPPSKSQDKKIGTIHRISHENWRGKHREQLWTNEMARIKFNVTQRNIAVRLNIRGQKAFDLGPHIIVRIDGRVVCRTLLTEEGWIHLVFTPEIAEGEHELSVQFINDFRNAKLSQDRNVFLGDLEIMYTEQK